ncbi:MAG: cryptochrome/photolyase family protein [Candidatus Dependentiae bacterium]
MKEVVLVFPHQLFEHHPLIDSQKMVIMWEHPRFFTDFIYHKNKLVLHRASMRFYKEELKKKGVSCKYFEYSKPVFSFLHEKNIQVIKTLELFDSVLEKQLTNDAKKHKVSIEVFQSPSFLCDQERIENLLGKQKYFRMSGFYIAQRKDFNILVADNKPVGGAWSFDVQNRKKLPMHRTIPEIWIPRSNTYVEEAKKYVEQNFFGNPGTTKNFVYPVTFSQAKSWFADFLQNRLKHFGDYQDAFEKEEVFTFHSLISPLVNTGLLTPDFVIKEAVDYTRSHSIGLNNLEGFIRQIAGWREFVRGVYQLKGNQQRNANFFKFTRKMPQSFYTGTTGIEPLDDSIKKVLAYGYVHHIERLMVLGNFMFLCEIDPNEVYAWFMELFVDAYDWVMIPNVYGMSQYADGGLMTTKPYFSSSNYIKNMSSYKNGPWAEIWDALFWRFIYKHQQLINNTPRLKIMNSYLKRLKPERLKSLVKTADNFLKNL